MRRTLGLLPRLVYLRRGYAKKITRHVVLDLPQGLQPLPPIVNTQIDDSRPQYSAVLQGALDNINKYPDCVVLTRVGGFYELYFNQAEQLHNELGLKRSFKDTKLGPVAMAGFPFFQLDRYLKVLVQEMGRHVAISEEFANDDSANKNLFDRRVSRIITPGTLIDEKFIESSQNNFLLAVQKAENKYGLAWMDVSTGDFFTQESSITSISSDIRRIAPKEIITSSDESLAEFATTRVAEAGVSEQWTTLVTTQFSLAEALAGSCLLDYISTTLPDVVVSIPPTKKIQADSMILDANALHALEIRRTTRDEARGSLLHAIKRTVTKSGTRLLEQRLISPSRSLQTINERLDLVELFMLDQQLKAEVTRFLKSSGDAVRVLQRFGFGRGEVDDLLTITKSISAAEELINLLSTHERAQSLVSKISVLSSLRKRILASIDEEGLIKRNREDADTAARVMQEVMSAIDPNRPVERRRKAIEREQIYTMRPSASPKLRQLHKDLDAMYREREELEQRLRLETGMQTLTLKTLPGLSHIIHIKNGDFRKSSTGIDLGRTVSSTKSTKSYQLPEWSYLGTRIESQKHLIAQEETSTFRALRKLVLQQSTSIRNTAGAIDEIDVSCSFASIASENGWTRPSFNTPTAVPVSLYSVNGTSREGDEEYTELIDSSHPIVEFSLRARGLPFTPNSIRFSPSLRAYIITGPNMGGKSTFLRQLATIQVLAQSGSFVPASRANLRVQDGVFTRIGAGDNLYAAQSTFLTEMLELAEIMNRATERSMVLIDECGRGTTVRDGMSIAYASLFELVQRGSTVVFATHFSELCDLITRDSINTGLAPDTHTDQVQNLTREGKEVIEETRKVHAKIGMLCTRATTSGALSDEISFSHKMESGICRDAHGLQVAQLAGLPDSTLDLARRIRDELNIK